MRNPVETDPSAKTVALTDAGEVIEALTSETARAILERLTEAPSPPSDLAEALDTSVQNVTYHLERLAEVGVVEVVDTWYSDRGREMNVYGAANAPLVIVAGSSDDEITVEREITATTTRNGAPEDVALGDGGIDTTTCNPSRDE